MGNSEQAKQSCELPRPFDCPVYRANLESASITECGLCVCTHCIQQSSERDKACRVCNKPIGSHRFSEYDRDSPEVIDSLFQIKDQEIGEKEAIIKEHEKKILQLKKKDEGLGRLVKALQDGFNKKADENKHLIKKLTATEKEVAQLKDKVKNKDDELNNLYVKVIPEKEHTINGLQTQVAQMTEKDEALGRLVKALQDGFNKKADENKHLIKKLTATEKEVAQLKDKVKNKDDELNNVYVKVIPEKEHTINGLQTQVAQMTDVLHNTTEEVERLNTKVHHLEVYVKICADQEAQLQELWGRVIPEKDQIIVTFEGHVLQLTRDLETLRSHTVFIANLDTLSGTNIHRAIQQLQHYYDREYRSRYEILERMELLLQTRLEDVMKELCENPEIGDRLALIIRTYVSVVKENSNLHRSLKAQKQDLDDLKRELRQIKANQFKTGQRHQSSYTCEE